MLDPNRIALTAEAVGFRKRTNQAVAWDSFATALQNQSDTIKTRREVAETPISVLHVMGGQRYGKESNEVLSDRAKQLRQINGYQLRSFSANNGPIVPAKKQSDSVMALPMNLGIPQYVRYNASAGQTYVSHFTEPLQAPLEHKETLMSRLGISALSNSATDQTRALEWQLNMHVPHSQIIDNSFQFAMKNLREEQMASAGKVAQSTLNGHEEILRKRKQHLESNFDEAGNYEAVSKAPAQKQLKKEAAQDTVSAYKSTGGETNAQAMRHVDVDLSKVDPQAVSFVGNNIKVTAGGIKDADFSNYPLIRTPGVMRNYEKAATRQYRSKFSYESLKSAPSSASGSNTEFAAKTKSAVASQSKVASQANAERYAQKQKDKTAVGPYDQAKADKYHRQKSLNIIKSIKDYSKSNTIEGGPDYYKMPSFSDRPVRNIPSFYDYNKSGAMENAPTYGMPTPPKNSSFSVGKAGKAVKKYVKESYGKSKSSKKRYTSTFSDL